MNSDNHHIPLKYICPLSGRLIKKPVKTSDGDIFDREAIEEWFKAGNVTNPISGQDLKNYDLFPEIVLREEI